MGLDVESSQMSALDALAKYDRIAKSGKKGGKVLIGLDRSNNLVVEVMSVWDYIKSFFTVTVATKYRVANQKERLVAELGARAVDELGNASETARKSALAGLKTLGTHIKGNVQLNALIRELENPKRRTRPMASGSIRMTRRTVPKPATTERDVRESGMPRRDITETVRARGASTSDLSAKPSRVSVAATRHDSKTTTLSRVESQVSEAQRNFAKAMSLTAKGQRSEQKVDIKKLNDAIKNWLLDNFLPTRRKDAPLSDFSITLSDVSAERMHVEIYDTVTTPMFSVKPTFKIDGARLKELRSLLTQVTNTDDVTYHIELLKRAVASRA